MTYYPIGTSFNKRTNLILKCIVYMYYDFSYISAVKTFSVNIGAGELHLNWLVILI